MHLSERHSRYAAATIAALFTALTIRYASFVGVISDGTAYVSTARRWLEGELVGALSLSQIPGWPSAWLEIPFGYRLGTISGTDVFTYPPGLPLVMAAAMAGGGELAVHLVPPVLGGILVWAAGELANLVGGRASRILGASLMATSAIALEMTVTPMSDVPTAAWWALSLVFSTRGRATAALAAGLAASMAILTRPNLALLLIVPAALAVTEGSRRVLCAVVFTTSALLGPAVLMWMQAMLYESPFASGHLGIEQTFALSNVASNLLRYPRWYAETHSPVVLLAACAPVVLWRARNRSFDPAARQAYRFGVALFLFGIGVYAAYLPYTPYSEPAFLRFMLPALAPLYALTAAMLGLGIVTLFRRFRPAVLALTITLTAGVQAYKGQQSGMTNVAQAVRPVLQAGAYLDAALPSNAVVMTAFHGGSIRHATRRPILRPDLIQPQQLDMVVGMLHRSGYHLYVLMDEELERDGFQQLFHPHMKTLTLDWPPRARIGDGGRLSLYDLDDARRFAAGQRWPVDVVR